MATVILRPTSTTSHTGWRSDPILTAADNNTATGVEQSRTTQQDGSSALTYAYVNNCSIKIVPNTQGITLYELYITVDYTEAGYSNKVLGIEAANISKIIGKAKSTIDKMAGK